MCENTPPHISDTCNLTLGCFVGFFFLVAHLQNFGEFQTTDEFHEITCTFINKSYIRFLTFIFNKIQFISLAVLFNNLK